MQESDAPSPAALHLNEDPITHAHGAHPVATGVGAAGGSAAAAAIGLVVGGPVGGVIGAVIGAFAGGLGGSAVGETLDPTIEAEEANLLDRAAAGPHLVTPISEDVVPWHEVIPSGLPSYEEIALRAYALYEAEGCPAHQDVRHWLEAEHALQAEAFSPPGN